MLYKKLFLMVGLLAIGSLPTSVSASIIQFDLLGRSGAGMRFDNENVASASGSGTGGEIGAGISFDDVSKVITINVGWGSGKGFTDLTGTVTAGHIHQAANSLFTTNGGVIVGLDGATPGFNSSATNGGWTNTTATLNAVQEAALNSGFLYLNAHTAANGGGEIRGNLIAVPEPSSMVLFGLAGMGAAFARFRRKKTVAV